MRGIILFLALTALWQPAEAETITVSEEDETGAGPLGALWDAIEAAAPGDTIRVAAGGFFGGGIGIVKPLTLIGAGANRTRVFAPNEVFNIMAEGVTIEGFHLLSNLHGRSLTTSVGCNNCSATLKHNIIDGGHFAVSVLGPSRLILNYNDLRGNFGIESLNNPNTVDARFNWWGTAQEDEVQERIASHRKPLVNISGHLTENTRSLVINPRNEVR